MLRKVFTLLAAGAVTLSLAACDFSATGKVECHTDASGKYVCTGSSTSTPETPPPTSTPPPTTETPPPTTEEPPPPADPNEGLPAATVNTGAQDGKVRVFWTTARTDITGWYISRNGTDTNGYGTWGTELPRSTTDVTFNLLRNGTEYTFTLVAHTANGNLPAVSAKATPSGPVTQPPVTDPPPATGTATAAERFGWGNKIATASDEFNYTGAPNSAVWHQAGQCWPGHAGNGGRCASNSKVDGSKLIQTGEANGDSGWLAARQGQKYGRWEARVRTEALAANNGRQYHPLLIVWPDSDRWPNDGEYDFFENTAPEQKHVGAFIHYPHPNMPVQQEYAQKNGVDTSEWHNIAFEWTPDHVKGFIDGQEWFSYSGGANGSRSNIQDMPSGHLTIQLDNFYGSNMQAAKYEVDWVRTYALR